MSIAKPDRFEKLTITGKFTEEDLKEIVKVVARIEKTKPKQLFMVMLDSPKLSVDKTTALIQKLWATRRHFEDKCSHPYENLISGQLTTTCGLCGFVLEDVTDD